MATKNKGTTKMTNVTPKEEVKVSTETPIASTVSVETEVQSKSSDVLNDLTIQQEHVETPIVSTEISEPASSISEDIVQDKGFTVDVAVEKESIVEENVFTIKKDDPFIVLFIKERLKSYVDAMDVKANSSVSQRVQAQKLLKSVIDSLVKTKGNDFSLAMDTLLAIMFTYGNTVFGSRYLYRDFDVMGLDPTTRINFTDILHVLTIIADPKARPSYGSQVSIQKALHGYSHDETFMQLFQEYLSK